MLRSPDQKVLVHVRKQSRAAYINPAGRGFHITALEQGKKILPVRIQKTVDKGGEHVAKQLAFSSAVVGLHFCENVTCPTGTLHRIKV